MHLRKPKKSLFLIYSNVLYENHVGAGVRHCKNLNMEAVKEKLHKKQITW